MDVRNRNPGNEYRFNSMGMDRNGPGRISPETSFRRNHNYYNRNNNNAGAGGYSRGFGRSRSFNPPAPVPAAPPRKGDVFMDAGRMAAEYLVAKGVLPPSVLSAKWGRKPDMFEGGDQMREDGRLSRLGNVSEGGYRRGRFGADELNSGVSNMRSNGERRKRNRGGYVSDTRPDSGSREYGRSVSLTDRQSRAASSEDGSASGRHEDENKLGGNAAWQQNVRESEGVADSGTKLEKEDVSLKPSSSGTNVSDGVAEVDVEPEKLSDVDMKDTECGINEETEKASVVEDLPVEVKPEGEGMDLLRMSNFAKVPTRIRSALTTKNLKSDPLPNIQEGSTSSGMGLQRGESSQGFVENSNVDVSSGIAAIDNSDCASCVDPETYKLGSSQSVENLVESGSGFGIEHNKFERSQSLPDRAFMPENEQKGPTGLRSFSFVVNDRSEKRTLENYDEQREAKKPREWLPYAESDDCFQISNLSEKKASPLADNTSPAEKVVVAVDQENSMGINPQFRKDGAEICIDYMQEKQLFPNSFDLNLIEVSDRHENRENRVINNLNVSEVKKEAASVDMDLSISNCNMSRESNRCTVDVKEIEVIDLEDDYIPEDKAFNNPERKRIGFIPLDSFSNQPQNSNGLPDGQDGYGQMISELLENDFPSCSSVPENLTPVPNNIGLSNGEGTLANDDSIYMSFDEIPFAFMRPWEQPTPQEYEKPF